jgi:hypothetical protein
LLMPPILDMGIALFMTVILVLTSPLKIIHLLVGDQQVSVLVPIVHVDFLDFD